MPGLTRTRLRVEPHGSVFRLVTVEEEWVYRDGGAIEGWEDVSTTFADDVEYPTHDAALAALAQRGEP